MVVKFTMWSPFHYIMIIFPFILAIILYYIFKNKTEQKKQSVAIIISIIMVFILIMRNVYIFVSKGNLNPEVIPFQVCHFANIIFLIASLSKNKVWGTIGWCLNFPAGLVSVIFADGLENYETMINIQAFAYIAGHMLIVTIGLYMLLNKMIKINKESIKKMYFIVALLYISSIFINNLFNKIFADTSVTSNYFYTFKPESGTPLEDIFNLGSNYTILGIILNPIYLILLGMVGAILLFGMVGLFRLSLFIRTRKNKITI